MDLQGASLIEGAEPVQALPPTKPRKIALVGTASSNINAPVKDETWEIWGVSARAQHITRATRWFEIHDLYGEPPDWAASWRAEIRAKVSVDCELVMLPQFIEPDLGPRVVPYPYQRIVRRFGSYHLTSTFSYMMALAIDELRPQDGTPVPGEIFPCGVEMEYGTEYKQQRNGFRHFMALAEFAGIPVTRLAASGLTYEPVPYPFWQGDPLLAKATQRLQRTTKNLNDWDRSLKATNTLIAQDAAVIAELKKLPDDLVGARIAQLEASLAKNTATAAKITRDMTQERGEHEAYAWLIDFLGAS